jgi:hypothetical protein
LFCLLALLFVVATMALPFVWSQRAKAKQRVVTLMDAMINVYAELKSDGAISAEHIRARSQKAADGGVIWPAPLFAMLDDIIRRTGRF